MRVRLGGPGGSSLEVRRGDVLVLPAGPGHCNEGDISDLLANTLSKRLPTSDASSSTKPVTIAVLFQRQELAPLLDHPLDLILPEEEPPTVAEMAKAPEADLVAQATARGLFSEQLQQAQDGSSLMILAPLPAQ